MLEKLKNSFCGKWNGHQKYCRKAFRYRFPPFSDHSCLLHCFVGDRYDKEPAGKSRDDFDSFDKNEFQPRSKLGEFKDKIGQKWGEFRPGKKDYQDKYRSSGKKWVYSCHITIICRVSKVKKNMWQLDYFEWLQKWNRKENV